MADRIVVYEGDSAKQLAEEFAMKHSFICIFKCIYKIWMKIYKKNWLNC